MSRENIIRPKLADVQENPQLLASMGLTSLAWLTHEAESDEDDMTFIRIQNLLQDRTNVENRIYNEEYRRLWHEHAVFRGYANNRFSTYDD